MKKIVVSALASLVLVTSEAEAQDKRSIGKLGRDRSPQAVAALLRDFPCHHLWVSKALEDSKNVIGQGRVILDTEACQKEPPSPWAERSRALLNPKQNVARKALTKPSAPDPHLDEIEELKQKLSAAGQKAASDLKALKNSTDLEKNELGSKLSAAQISLEDANKRLAESPRPSNFLWAALVGAILAALFVLVAVRIWGENFASARIHETVTVGGNKHTFTLVDQHRSGQGYDAIYQCDQCNASPLRGDKASLKKHVQEDHPGARISP